MAPTHIENRLHLKKGDDTFSHEGEGKEAFCIGHPTKLLNFIV
jgi:hypothetical protein